MYIVSKWRERWINLYWVVFDARTCDNYLILDWIFTMNTIPFWLARALQSLPPSCSSIRVWCSDGLTTNITGPETLELNEAVPMNWCSATSSTSTFTTQFRDSLKFRYVVCWSCTGYVIGQDWIRQTVTTSKEFYESLHCLTCCNHRFLALSHLSLDRFLRMPPNHVRNTLDSWCSWHSVTLARLLRFDSASCSENVSGIAVTVGNILTSLWKLVVLSSLLIPCWLVTVGFLCIDRDVYDACITNISYRKHLAMRFIPQEMFVCATCKWRKRTCGTAIDSSSMWKKSGHPYEVHGWITSSCSFPAHSHDTEEHQGISTSFQWWFLGRINQWSRSKRIVDGSHRSTIRQVWRYIWSSLN